MEKIKAIDLKIGSTVYYSTVDKIEERHIKELKDWMTIEDQKKFEEKLSNDHPFYNRVRRNHSFTDRKEIRLSDGINESIIPYDSDKYFIGDDNFVYLNLEDAIEKQKKLQRNALSNAEKEMIKSKDIYNDLKKKFDI